MTTKELLSENIIKANIGTSSAAPKDDDTNKSETNDNDEDTNWWLIPSILASVALLLALLGVFIRKLYEAILKKREVKYENSGAYDRRIVDDADNANENTTVEVNKAYEEFDDVLPPAPTTVKATEKRTVEPKQEPTVEESDNSSQSDDVSEVPDNQNSFVDEFDD